MQQNATASQQVLQAVTTLQNQIPVTRYVSVITGKSDSVKTVGNIIKPIPNQTRHNIDSSRTLISNPISLSIKRHSAAAVRTAFIRGELGDGSSIGIQVKQAEASALAVDELGEVYNIFKTPSQHQRQQPQIHVQNSQQLHPTESNRQAHVDDILTEFELAQQELTNKSTSQLYTGNSLQYVDSSGDHVYSNGSTANSFQYTGNNHLYTNSQQNNDVYFDSPTASAHVGSQATVSSTQHMNSLGVTGSSGSEHQNINQLISSPGGSTYLIQGAANEGGIVAMPISHSSRASPATVSLYFRREPKTVQWLMEHFESAEGVSLPRALMYNHYLLHCREQNLDPVNAASYGKLVRSVFVGLRTRRLGTRGNSKYHYYGIRIKANSPLNRLHDDLNYIAMRQQPTTHNKRFKTLPGQAVDKPRDSASSSLHVSISDQVQQQAQQHQQYLGDATQALPDFDPIQVTSDDDPMPDGLSQEDLMGLEDLYRDHCANVLDIIVSLQFSVVETVWKTFWRAKDESDEIQAAQNELEHKLSRHKLISLCQYPPVQRWVKDSDHQMFQSLVEVLIPDVLRPIPSALTLAIRNFAKGLETCLSNVLDKCDLSPEIVKIKLTAVSAFSQTLRRYTSLNHLAQAARAVMNDSALTNQMLVDLNRVDFTNVQEQASWVCQCEDSTVHEIEAAFKAALSEQRSLEDWADWLETVVVKVLKPHEKDVERYTDAARQFLLKWCFYSSMVIRDLTLRSAVSFGSFHLIRLLYDEYMFYLVEHRVAHTTGETAIAVMSEFSSQRSGGRPSVAASPASTTSDLSSNRSPAFIASALISNANNQATKPIADRGTKRNASEMEARVLSVVQVNGKFPSITNNTAKIDSANSG